MSQVLPSGGDFATQAVPTLPEAPARFSMITVVLSLSCSGTCTSRMMASEDPPGG